MYIPSWIILLMYSTLYKTASSSDQILDYSLIFTLTLLKHASELW